MCPNKRSRRVILPQLAQQLRHEANFEMEYNPGIPFHPTTQVFGQSVPCAGLPRALSILEQPDSKNDESPQVTVSNWAAAGFDSSHTQHIRNVVRLSIPIVTNGHLCPFVAEKETFRDIREDTSQAVVRDYASTKQPLRKSRPSLVTCWKWRFAIHYDEPTAHKLILTGTR